MLKERVPWRASDCGVVQEADLERFHCFICGGPGGNCGCQMQADVAQVGCESLGV